MIRTLEAVIDEDGAVSLLEPVQLPAARRALAMVLEGEPRAAVSDAALFSEPALARDWNRPEEDDGAWSYLQREVSSSYGFPSPTFRRPVGQLNVESLKAIVEATVAILRAGLAA